MVGFGGEDWVGPLEAEVGAFRLLYSISALVSLLLHLFQQTGHALEVIPAPSRNLPSECGQKIMESPVPLAEGQRRGDVESRHM